ncbi:hypothetical protein ACFYOD_33200 [Streptomyces sp. NPDC006703]|uniref:hypothetical protein n=1 Tax=Streptomyces sp. NPDC006703 TaxID=3364759 RepID=UPI0036C4D292
MRVEALLLHHRKQPMPRSVFETEGVRDRAVESCRLERGLAEHLARHGQPAQRCSLAGNPHLDPDLVGLLAKDPDENVRFVVATRADITEEQRAGIPINFDPRRHYLVERFSRDSNEEVRHRAASDPRLSPASAVLLLDDPHERVRYAAALHPRLPARVMIRLLRDADTAQTAARHPALPVPVMEQMLQRIQPAAPVTPGP